MNVCLNFIEIVQNLGVKIRIGIHYGKTFWAKIGKNAENYDIFGETPKITLELQNECQPNKILISESIQGLLGIFTQKLNFKKLESKEILLKNKQIEIYNNSLEKLYLKSYYI